MNREWIRKETLVRKRFRRMSWATLGREAGISGQTVSKVEHDPDNVGTATWMRLMDWVQDPKSRPNARENLRAFRAEGRDESPG